MNKLFATIICIGLAPLMAAGPTTPKVGSKIEGTWTAVAGIIDGKEVPEETFANAKLVVTLKDGKYKMTRKDKEIESGAYKLDVFKKPAAIDLTITTGKDDTRKILGIYKFDGDKLTIAISPARSPYRPETFDGRLGVEITVLKRNKVEPKTEEKKMPDSINPLGD